MTYSTTQLGNNVKISLSCVLVCSSCVGWLLVCLISQLKVLNNDAKVVKEVFFAIYWKGNMNYLIFMIGMILNLVGCG